MSMEELAKIVILVAQPAIIVKIIVLHVFLVFIYLIEDVGIFVQSATLKIKH